MILSDDINKCSTLLSPKLTSGIEYRISSDSRKLLDENCFLSLYGDNFDSIHFIADVIQKGAKTIVLENREVNKSLIENLENENKDTLFVKVENIFQFILELGRVRSERFQSSGGKLVGITGSNGKTTNKEMLKSLFSFLGADKVHATKGNLNNQIGVPLTLFDLEDFHEVAIVEMGTNFPGEIESLVRCARPQYGFITNIGYAHIEFLKDLDGVFKEKSALYKEIKEREEGLFIVNSFDKLLSTLDGKENTISLKESDLNIFENSSLLGQHQKINMAMCCLLAMTFYPQNRVEIVENANNFSPPNMNRGELKSFGKRTVYLDAYNANPSSMKASLNAFVEFLKKNNHLKEDALPILGDMNELGEGANGLHEDIGQFLKNLGFKKAAFVGRYSKDYLRGFGPTAETYHTTNELKRWVAEDESPQNVWFIKGSRSLQLESILDING